MKTFLLSMIVVIAALFWTVSGKAGEYVTVPRTLGEIINPHFRTALETQAGNYDILTRSMQIQVFTEVYKSLNKGQNPVLAPRDSGFFPGDAFYGSPFPPSSYANPLSGDVYQYYNNYGYRRFPSVSPLPPPAWSATPYSAPYYGMYPNNQSWSNRTQPTPPPYARPPVARPHAAPHSSRGRR